MSWMKVDAPGVTKTTLGSRPLDPETARRIAGTSPELQHMITELYSTKKVPSVIGDGYFILEAYITVESLSGEDVKQILVCLEGALDIPKQNLFESMGTSADQYYYNVRILAALLMKNEVIESPHLLNTITLLSYHIHPHLPWTNEVNSTILQNVLSDQLQSSLQTIVSDFISTRIKPNLLVLPKINKQPLHGGLQPRLGYGGAKKEILEEDARRNWKQTSKIKVLSMMWFVISLARKSEWFDSNWSIIASFILNLGDDHDPLIKYQACLLLRLLMEKLSERDDPVHLFHKSGLLELFVEFCKKCLSHIPNITPENRSLLLLKEAYPCIIELLKISNERLAFIDLANNILSSITHMVSGTGSPFTIIGFLVQQLTVVVTILEGDVLISISRINYSLSQLITNPYTLDSNQGRELIENCLKCQHTIISHFVHLNDKSAALLVSSYKYDYIGSWLVLLKRTGRLDEKQAHKLNTWITTNFDILKQLTITCDEVKEFSEILATVNSQHPELNGHMVNT